ncbi:hypothetical protein [Paenibacillus alvei]|uniref:Peptidase S8/S53 domain-containing protein n=1 Tax=Paenibacillus alvei TaxID=44250 RepID=A0AAP7A006_PAEAL|nr:hypothetical protein [Paenibacillus alvei]NOJ73110.1 hypothetical protein [Paenibacillus alvei]
MDKKIRVIVIDSGINEDLYLKCYIRNYISLIKSDTIKVKDEHGHGTAIIGMLNDFCKDLIDITVIRVLDEKCSSSCSHLLEAIDISIDLNPDIINLSLGTEDLSYVEDFKVRCKLANEKDILLVTTDNGSKYCLPSMMEETVRVKKDERVTTEDLYYNKSYFCAIGIPHIVPWKDLNYVFVNRNSFVTPYFINEFVGRKIKNNMFSNNEIQYRMRNEVRKIENTKLIRRKHECVKNIYWYQIIVKITTKIFGEFNHNVNLFKQGFTMSDCIELLLQLKLEFSVEIPFTKFNLYDFEYVSNLSNKVCVLLQET